MKKLTIEQITKANYEYLMKKRELDLEYCELKRLNSLIDLDEVESKLNYSDTKALYELLNFLTDDSDVEKQFKEILNTKKIAEYPDVLGVHYYPEIKEINFLSEQEKIDLDVLVKNAIDRPKFQRKLSDLDMPILEWLISKNIMKKDYTFSCDCQPSDCSKIYVSEDRKREFYEYHNFDYDSATDEEIEEHEENYEKGYIFVSCWNDGDYEVSDIKDFEEKIDKVCTCTIIKKPDMTLDYI